MYSTRLRFDVCPRPKAAIEELFTKKTLNVNSAEKGLKFIITIMFLFFQSNTSIAACKESTVRYPGDSGFCYRAGEFFWGIEITEEILSILFIKMTSGLVLSNCSLPAWQAVKSDFLCTLQLAVFQSWATHIEVRP